MLICRLDKEPSMHRDDPWIGWFIRGADDGLFNAICDIFLLVVLGYAIIGLIFVSGYWVAKFVFGVRVI